MQPNEQTITGHDKGLKRFLEIIPGFLVWTALLFPVVFSFTAPALVAYFIIVFYLYWLLKAFYMSRNLLHSYARMKVEKNFDWYKKLEETKNIENTFKQKKEKLLELRKNIYTTFPLNIVFRFFSFTKDDIFYKQYLRESLEESHSFKNKHVLPYEEIYHLVILATFQEDVSILRESINGVLNSNFPSEKILFVLAGEERDKERFAKYAEILKKEFGDEFGFFLTTVHPKDLPKEVKGKGGNITYAARQAKKIIDEKEIPYKNIVTTTLDADNIVHKEYFASLTYRYVINPYRKFKSFQPVPIFNNNIWDVPAIIRIVAMSNGFWQLMESSRPERLRNFSSHAQGFEALVDTDFWSTESIVEDGHQFWRTFFTYDGNHEVVPMFLPIFQDAVQEKSYLKTLKAQYIQLRRWAWGASDFPYVVINAFSNNKIPFYKKFLAIFRVTEGYFSWATAPLFITIAGWLPGLINQSFKYSVVALNLPIITKWLLTIATVGIITSILISVSLLPPRPKRYNKIRHSFMVIQWVLLPIVTIFFSSIPAIDAQTRLAIGKRLDWKVTKKIRSNK